MRAAIDQAVKTGEPVVSEGPVRTWDAREASAVREVDVEWSWPERASTKASG